MPSAPVKNMLESDETLVIANTMADPSQWENVRHLRASDFLREDYKKIWTAMQGAALDPIGVNPMAVISIDPTIEMSVIQNLMDQSNGSPSALSAAAYRLSTRRRTELALHYLEQCISNIKKTQGSDYRGSDWLSIIAETNTRIADLSGDIRTVGNADLEAQLLREVHAPPKRIKTGIFCLDEWFGGGIMPGQMIGIAAETKVGKTVFATTISGNLDKQTTPHLFYTNERSELEIGRLKLARKLNKQPAGLLSLTEQEKASLISRRNPLNTSHIIYRPSATIEDIETEIRYQVDTNGAKVLIIDQLQLIVPRSDKKMIGEQHMAHVSTELLRITTSLKIATIVMLQISDSGFYTQHAEPFQRSAHAVLHLRRDIGEDKAYLQTKSAAIGKEEDIGSINVPSLLLHPSGPHFEDAENH